jgi:hypothetical protein
MVNRLDAARRRVQSHFTIRVRQFGVLGVLAVSFIPRPEESS